MTALIGVLQTCPNYWMKCFSWRSLAATEENDGKWMRKGFQMTWNNLLSILSNYSANKCTELHGYVQESAWSLVGSVPNHDEFEHALGCRDRGPWSPMQYSWGQSHQPLLKSFEASPGFSCHDTTWVTRHATVSRSDTFKPGSLLCLLQWTC